MALAELAFLAASLPCLAAGGGAASLQESVPEGHCIVLPEEPVDPAVTAEWNGRTLAFCCPMCRKQFLAEPQAFAALLPPLEGPGSEPLAPSGSSAAPRQAGDAAPAAPALDGRAGSWAEWLGRTHPLLVHFPIALLVLAGASELLARPGGRWRSRARLALALGAPLALATAGLGWLAAAHARYPSLTGVLERHRWLGVATALLAAATLALAPPAREPGRPRERVYRWCLLATIVLVVLAGHHGATLVFGPGWLLPPR